MDRKKAKDVNGSADFVMEINRAYRSPDFLLSVLLSVTAWVEQLRTADCTVARVAWPACPLFPFSVNDYWI